MLCYLRPIYIYIDSFLDANYFFLCKIRLVYVNAMLCYALKISLPAIFLPFKFSLSNNLS